MDKFLEMYDLPWRNQEEIHNKNTPINSNENESEGRNSQQTKV